MYNLLTFKLVTKGHNRLFISVISVMSVILTLIFCGTNHEDFAPPLPLPIQLHFRLQPLYWWDACRLGRIIGSIYREGRIRTKNYKQCRLFGLYQLVLISKTPNPKCRLCWCSIEFIDWRDSQSCLYFRPLLWNIAPLTFSLVPQQKGKCKETTTVLVILKYLSSLNELKITSHFSRYPFLSLFRAMGG